MSAREQFSPLSPQTLTDNSGGMTDHVSVIVHSALWVQRPIQFKVSIVHPAILLCVFTHSLELLPRGNHKILLNLNISMILPNCNNIANSFPSVS